MLSPENLISHYNCITHFNVIKFIFIRLNKLSTHVYEWIMPESIEELLKLITNIWMFTRNFSGESVILQTKHDPEKGPVVLSQISEYRHSF